MTTAAGTAPDGRQKRWQEHNDQRRQRIIAAAIELIESGDPDLSLQAVARRAGLSRSVVYRQFADRRELDLAIQSHVIESLWGELLPALHLEGSVRETIERVIGVYVGWAVGHPRLHRRFDYDTTVDGNGPLQQTLDMISAQVAELLTSAFEALGADLTDADRAATDPLVYGLVGAVFGSVRRWIRVGEGTPDAEHMVELLTEAAWAVIETRARAFGLDVDPDTPLEALLTSG